MPDPRSSDRPSPPRAPEARPHRGLGRQDEAQPAPEGLRQHPALALPLGQQADDNRKRAVLASRGRREGGATLNRSAAHPEAQLSQAPTVQLGYMNSKCMFMRHTLLYEAVV